MFKGRILAGVLLIFSLGLAAQPAPSPFSSVGIGKLNYGQMIQQQAAGGVGVGMGSYWNINNMNPAMLMYTRGTIFADLTVFQAGTTYDSKIISSPGSSEESTGTGLSYLSMGFPVIQGKWFSSIGLMPYSEVNYNMNYETTFPGTTEIAEISRVGSGGINQLYWSNGVTVHKNLSVGLKAQVLFSSIFRETSTKLNSTEVAVNFSSAVYERNNFGGILLTGGLVYQDSIKTKGDEPIKFALGLNYELGGNINVKEFESIQRRLLSGTIWEADTVKNNIKSKLDIPSGFGIGVSFSKFFKWNIGLDLRMRNYEGFNYLGETGNTQNSIFVGLGGELTPDAFAVDSYLKRVTFRAGASYESSPYLINGMAVNDFGINFGLSLPIVPSTTGGSVITKGFSSVDIGVQYGVLGSVDSNTLQEEYFKVHFGVTFNDRWFVKRKFN